LKTSGPSWSLFSLTCFAQTAVKADWIITVYSNWNALPAVSASVVKPGVPDELFMPRVGKLIQPLARRIFRRIFLIVNENKWIKPVNL